jgi:hypothetical protein
MRRADPLSKESYRLCIDEAIEKAAKVHKGCRARYRWTVDDNLEEAWKVGAGVS